MRTDDDAHRETRQGTCDLKAITGASTYFGAPFLPSEESRLNVLHEYDLDIHKPNPQFEAVTKLMCQTLDMPIATVAFIDHQHAYVKSGVGMPEFVPVDRRMSFCTWTLVPLKPEVLLVEDASKDGRFKDHPLVTGETNLRFYAGTPLVTRNGFRLGTLCVIDFKPRRFGAECCNLLCNFAELIMQEVTAQMGPKSGRQLRDANHTGALLLDTSSKGWRILYVSSAWNAVAGSSRNGAVCEDDLFWEQFCLDAGGSQLQRSYQSYAESYRAFKMVVQRTSGSKSPRFCVDLKPATRSKIWETMGSTAIASSAHNVEPHSETSGLYFAVLLGHATEECLDADGEQEQATPFPGLVLGPMLGQGAFGRVFCGIYNDLQVAVKEQHDNDFQRLAKRARLDHVAFNFARHVVQPKKEKQTWIVLEYCDRGCLQQVIDDGTFRSEHSVFSGGPKLGDVLEVAFELAEGMEYLHSKHVTHGDLTPKNVLLVSKPTSNAISFSVKVSDFGLSREQQCMSRQTDTYGTVTHMPSELVVSGKISKASDVYAFGVILWELYTSKRPWAGFNSVQVVAQKLMGNQMLPFPEGTPEPYKELAESCMAKEPRARPTFSQILLALHDLREGLKAGQHANVPCFSTYDDPKHLMTQAISSYGDYSTLTHVDGDIGAVGHDSTGGSRAVRHEEEGPSSGDPGPSTVGQRTEPQEKAYPCGAHGDCNNCSRVCAGPERTGSCVEQSTMHQAPPGSCVQQSTMHQVPPGSCVQQSTMHQVPPGNPSQPPYTNRRLQDDNLEPGLQARKGFSGC